MKSTIHPIQAMILRELLFKENARFSDLNWQKIRTDQFTFHLKSLIKAGLVKKASRGFYSLTARGKEFANRLDTKSLALEKQAKISVLIIGINGQGKTKKYLVQQRLKQPYFGFYGFVTGKVKWGETILEAANREFKEETGLEAKLKLVGIEHKMDYSERGEFLEEKYFFIVLAENPKGNLKRNFEGGRNLWLTKNEILNLEKLFEDVPQILKLIDQRKFFFFEKKYKVEKY